MFYLIIWPPATASLFLYVAKMSNIENERKENAKWTAIYFAWSYDNVNIYTILIPITLAINQRAIFPREKLRPEEK